MVKSGIPGSITGAELERFLLNLFNKVFNSFQLPVHSVVFQALFSRPALIWAERGHESG